MPGKNNIGAEKEENEEKKPAPAGGGGRKEKSVLQAKLTKLAIQIGYAGKYPYCMLNSQSSPDRILVRCTRMSACHQESNLF